MIWLSRLLLDPRCRDVQRDLGDCQALHRTVMAAFPTAQADVEGARACFGVLFRQEQSRSSPGRPALLVQSTAVPDWSRLPRGYLLDGRGRFQNPDGKRVDEIYAAIENGAVLRFRLRANPTRKIDTRSGPDGARRNGKRVELRGEAEQIAWLRRKGEQGGFRLLAASGRSDVNAVLATGDDKIVGRRVDPSVNGDAASARLTFGSVVFDGTLVVTDAEQFRTSLADGIGPGKAYGFGLLSVARPTP